MSIPLTWLGHASFRLDSPGGKRIYVDPWLTGNPKCPEAEQKPERVDLIALTHGHGDHVGDTVELWKQFKPPVRGAVELRGWLASQGVEASGAAGPNKGGTVHRRRDQVHADRRQPLVERPRTASTSASRPGS